MMATDLEGKVAIVTGAGGGIGRGIIRQFVKHGTRVTLVDIDDTKARSTEKELLDLGGDVLCLVCDITDEEVTSRIVDETLQRFGSVDILVNDAYYGPPPQPLGELSLAEWETCFRTGPTATFLLARAVFPHMRDRGGKIINFGSELSLHPQEGRTCYAASKGAIQAFTRSLAWEWGRYRINVNCVWPSAVTPSWLRWEAVDPAGVERVLETEMAIKRRGDPEMDVGRAVMFLASEASDWVTGQTLGANGGRTFV
jgi:NAD(P)-dependent dehydrogenase (short-subunit alcohol dehydrogenase family)